MLIAGGNIQRLIAGTFLCLIAPVAIAQQNGFAQQDSVFAINAKLGFFEQGSVVDTSRPLEYTSQNEIQMGPTKGFDISQEFAVDKDKISETTKLDSKAAEEKIPEGVDREAWLLEKEFGDPSVPVPVKGTENAPTPYKAMLRAFDMGRDDLALQYAEQWMGYMQSLDRVTKKATTMSQIVGLRPEQVERNLPAETLAQIDAAGLQKYLENKQNKLADVTDSGSLDLEESTVEKINALFGENEGQNNMASVLNNSPINQIMDYTLPADQRRRLIRQHLSSQLPRDPSGRIKILFFMQPSDLLTPVVGRELTKVLASEDNTFPLAVVPLSIEPINAGTTSNFVKMTGLPAVVRDGVALYRSLNISKAPAVVFLTSASEKSFIQTGPVDSVFIQEVVNIIGGK